MEYTINKVAQLAEVSTYTLRYYEKEGLLLNIKRNENGRRIYSEEDISWVGFIKCLRDTGMTISDIKDYMSLVGEGEGTVEDRKTILINHRKKLLKQMELLRKSLGKIDNKIRWYNGQRINQCCD